MRRICVILITFGTAIDRKSTRLNSSHSQISYAVFCLQKKNFIRKQTEFYRGRVDAEGRAVVGEQSIFIEFLYRCPSINLQNICVKWHLIECSRPEPL